MLVFGTRLHIITFLIILLELVFFFYQIVYYLSRTTDKKRLHYLILLYLLMQHNLISGLAPDKNLPINIILQSIIAYGASFAMVMYLPYYFYKAFDLVQLKFHAYWGSLLFLFLPFVGCFAIPYAITGNLDSSRKLAMIIPFFYALSLLFFLYRAIKIKNIQNPDIESKRELTSVFIGVVLFVFLPVVAFFQSNIDTFLAPIFHFDDGSQLAEIFASNSGLLVFTVLFIRQTIKQSRAEYNKLLESEIKLQELNAGLTLKVQERTKELELANEQRTNTFINLAHETKTPLTLINNYLEEYIRKYEQTEELKVIKYNIEKLTQDIVNFFDIEKIEKGLNVYNNCQIVSFSKMLLSNMVLFKQYSSKKNIEIMESIEDDVFVKADPESLYRIVNNLIENAIKYTQADGKIRVSLKCVNNKINFSVKDNGIGIPANLHSKIFDPYYQINSEKKNFQGMGMGLSIVKKIIESLNGEIILISDPEKSIGTEMIVQLPIYKIVNGEAIIEFQNNSVYYFESEQLTIKEDEYDENKPTIMVVEDNIPLINYMHAKLKEKYNIHFALNGNEALDKLKQIKQLDLIISDVMMDNGDGFDFYDGISTQKRFRHIPFIFLTAKTNIEDKLRGLSLGAIDYISKPFLIVELTNKIDSVLNNLSEQREALIHNVNRTLLHQNGEQGHLNNNNQNHFEDNCDKFNLTSREKEIVLLIAKGQTYKEIANTLHISDKTVGKHIQNMFEKVGASNKSELVNKLGVTSFT